MNEVVEEKVKSWVAAGLVSQDEITVGESSKHNCGMQRGKYRERSAVNVPEVPLKACQGCLSYQGLSCQL